MKCLSIGLIAILLVCTSCAPSDAPEDVPSDDFTTTAAFAFSGDFRGPLGLQLWSVRQALSEDLRGTLEWIRNAGFQEVEVAGTHGLSAREFRQELNRVGLRATSMHVGYEYFLENPDAALDDAEILGVDYVGIAWIPHTPGAPFDSEIALDAAQDFNWFGEVTAARGFQFFYHNHGYEFRPEPDGTIPFDVLIEDTDPDLVKFQMDVFWTIHPGVDPAALLRAHPERWILLHIKDLAHGVPTPDYSGGAPAETKVPVGTGQVNWPDVLRAAQEIGIHSYYIEDESPDPIGNIPRSIQYLERVTF